MCGGGGGGGVCVGGITEVGGVDGADEGGQKGHHQAPVEHLCVCVCARARACGWMDGWTDGWREGWMD